MVGYAHRFILTLEFKSLLYQQYYAGIRFEQKVMPLLVNKMLSSGNFFPKPNTMKPIPKYNWMSRNLQVLNAVK